MEFSPKDRYDLFCNLICKKGHKNKWLYKLRTNDVFITNLVQKDLTTNY